MPVAIKLDEHGNLVEQPKRHATFRVFPTSGRTDGIPIAARGMDALRDDPEQRRIFVEAASSFAGFLRVWQFLDQESGQVRTLGDELWPAQLAYLDATEQHRWLYMLKARQLGETTIAIAYDAFVLRFRDRNARVHCFSTGDDQSKEVLENILFGLERLPPSMQVEMRTTTRSIRLDFSQGERAFVRSYAATRAASRGSTCGHLHLDEWSAQLHPAKVYQSTMPTVAPEGSFHILTTEVVGPESDSATYYRRCVEGNGKHEPIFVSALARPGRNADWLEAMRRSMPKSDFAKEYPSSWEEALESSGDRMFSAEDLDACATDALGCWNSQAEYESTSAKMFAPTDGRKPKRRRYSAGVDVGLKHDASVIIICDVTEELVDVIYYRRLIKPSVGELYAAIEDVHARFPSAHINIEDSGIGFPIRQGVNVRESLLHGLLTTGISKPRMLGQLQVLIEQHLLAYPADELPQLDRELRSYATPDTALTTDSVMALTFAIAGAEHALSSSGDGRILGVHKF